MIDPAMLEALQQQLTVERQNSVNYSALANRAEFMVLPGLAKFLRTSSTEETEHAQKFTDYLIDRNAEPLTDQLTAYGAPACTIQNAGSVLLTDALMLERKNTQRINALCKMALDAFDFQTFEFLKWAVAEQTSSERELMDMVTQWTFAEGCPSAVLALDRELGE